MISLVPFDQGFRKVDPDRWEFANEGFLRGQKQLLKTINRRKPSLQGNSQPQQPQLQNAPLPACVEVGKFGLEEEIERLKRDKNVLMQELVRLRQQQQTTDHQLQTLGKRLQGMESRQQQMMSFLAKAMQSPGFLAQFVQQNENSRRRIVAVNKKRRLPKQDGGLDSESASASLDGQIIKYQPMINEAAKAMLRKILKLDASHRLESVGNSDNFLLENYMPGPQDFDSSSSTRNSGVTLAEVPATSGLPYVAASSGLSAICSSAVAPEIQCPVLLDSNSSNQVPNMSVVPPVSKPIAPAPSDITIPEFPDLADIVPEDTDIPVGPFGMPGPEFPLTEEGDDSVPIETDDILYNDETQKLPAIVDSFWEQFLVGSPLSVDNDEVDSGVLDTRETPQENGWNKLEHMTNLTEQMGLLSPNHRV
jgi:heat shock transcription factor